MHFSFRIIATSSKPSNPAPLEGFISYDEAYLLASCATIGEFAASALRGSSHARLVGLAESLYIAVFHEMRRSPLPSFTQILEFLDSGDNRVNKELFGSMNEISVYALVGSGINRLLALVIINWADKGGYWECYWRAAKKGDGQKLTWQAVRLLGNRGERGEKILPDEVEATTDQGIGGSPAVSSFNIIPIC